MLVGDGCDGRRCLVRHCRRLDGAGALLLQMDLLGFPQEESINIRFDLVARDCLRDLVIESYLDVRVRVLHSHDGAKMLHREEEAVNWAAPPDGVAIIGQRCGIPPHCRE
jgi:hypothetical protein